MNEILIYDIIGQDFFGAGVIAKDVKEQLDSFGDAEQITVRVNSPGGDVFEGNTIYNLLAEHPAEITVKIDGYAASIASIIAMAGDKVEIAENAMFMIHNPYTFSVGDAAELRAQADVLDQVKASLISTYKTRVNSDDLSDLMDAETWFSAAEAVEFGFADAISGKKAAMHNVAGCRWINKAPQVEEAPKGTKPEPAYLDYLEQSARLAQERRQRDQFRKSLAI